MHYRFRNAVTCLLVLAAVLALFSSGPEPLVILKPLFGCEQQAGFGSFHPSFQQNTGGFPLQTTVITANNNGGWGVAVSVAGFDDCMSPGWPQWINLWANSCSFLQADPYSGGNGIFPPDVPMFDAGHGLGEQWDGGTPDQIMSVTTQTNAWSTWGVTIVSPLLALGVNEKGQPTTNWCVTVTEESQCNQCMPLQNGQLYSGWVTDQTLYLPLTVINPSAPSNPSVTPPPNFIPTTPGICLPVICSTVTSPGFNFPFLTFSTTSTSVFTHFFQSLTMPGSAGVSTDWAVLSVSSTPSTPQEGDQVIFSMQMAALSSSGVFPQNVDVECTVDGMGCGGGSVPYAGPGGVSATVTASTPWTATPGTHTLTWSVSTANDPDTSNNVMSTTFTVGSPAQTTISASTPTPTPLVTETTASLQTPTSTMIPSLGVVITVNQATPASPSTQAGSSPSNLVGMLSQTDLLLISAIVVLVALLVVTMYRRRKTSGPATGQGAVTDVVYCCHCGAQSSTTMQFCKKCGEKL